MAEDTDDEGDEHTGVSTVPVAPGTDDTTVEYTYEHVDETPEPEGDFYRVVGVVELKDRPTHRNAYYVPAEDLDRFVRGLSTEVFEEIVDIQPASEERVERELEAYRDSAPEE